MSANLVTSTEPATGVIRSQCVHCNLVFRIDPKFAGHIVDCPKCWGKMQIVPLANGAVTIDRHEKRPGDASISNRLFSPMQIAIGTFLGSPLAGGALLARNFYQLGSRTAALTAGLIGVGLFVVELTAIIWLSQWFAPLLLQIMAAAFQLIQSAMFGAYAWDRWRDLPATTTTRRPTRTGWQCVGITLAGGLIGYSAYLVTGMFILS